jgi:hypothetical protein
MKARYYTPWLSRWICTDPLGPVDNLSLYVYCINNPLRMTDQEGTQSHEAEGAQAAPPKTDTCQTSHHRREEPRFDAELFEDLGIDTNAEPTAEDIQKWLNPPKPKPKGKPARPRQSRNAPVVTIDNPFPNLATRAKTSAYYRKEYGKAMQSWIKYKKMEYFRFYYLVLGETAKGNDTQGISGGESSLLKGTVKETESFMTGKVRGDLIEHFGGTKLNIVIDRALLLVSLKAYLDNEKLANMADRSMDKARFVKNLKKARWAMAEAIRRQAGGTRIYWENWLFHQYQEFEPVFNEYSNYKLLDESLAPGYQNIQTIRRVPGGR